MQGMTIAKRGSWKEGEEDRFMIYLRDEQTYFGDQSDKECDERGLLA